MIMQVHHCPPMVIPPPRPASPYAPRLILFILLLLSISSSSFAAPRPNPQKTVPHMSFKFPPLVDFDGQAVRISEGRKNGSFIALVEVISPESSANQNEQFKPFRRWQLTSSSPAFRLDHKHHSSWTLNLNADADREQKASYNFTVDAIEIVDLKSSTLRRPPIKIQERLLVKVMDVNDNPPVFDKSLYTTSVTLMDTNRDASDNDVLIARLEASDKDQGENSRIEYFLDNYDDLFRIDRRSGHIFYRSSLLSAVSGGESGRFDVVIRARDQGSPALSSTTIMRVSVHSLLNNAGSSDQAAVEPDHQSTQRLTVLTICAIGACLLVLLIVVIIAGSGILCTLWVKGRLSRIRKMDHDPIDEETSENTTINQTNNNNTRTHILTPPATSTTGCCIKKPGAKRKNNFREPKSPCSSSMTAKNGSNSTATSACSTGYLSSVMAFGTNEQILPETKLDKPIHLRNNNKDLPYTHCSTNKRVACERVYTRFYGGMCEKSPGDKRKMPRIVDDDDVDDHQDGGIHCSNILSLQSRKCISSMSPPVGNGVFCHATDCNGGERAGSSNLSSPVNSTSTTSCSINALARSAMIPNLPMLSILRPNYGHQNSKQSSSSLSKSTNKDSSASFV